MKKLLLSLLTALSLCAQAAPFQPYPYDTASLAVTGTAQNITLPGPSYGTGLEQFVFLADGTVTVFFRCDGVPVTASGAGLGQPIKAGMAYIISLPATTTTCSVIASGAGSTLYVTMGFGQ